MTVGCEGGADGGEDDDDGGGGGGGGRSAADGCGGVHSSADLGVAFSSASSSSQII